MKLGADIYVKVYANKFSIRRVGDETDTEVLANQPFTTKRLLVGDFLVAETLLAESIKKLMGFSLFSPRILIQPMDMIEEGLSPVEVRIFKELASEASARLAVVWVGEILSDREVTERLNQQKDIVS